MEAIAIIIITKYAIENSNVINTAEEIMVGFTTRKIKRSKLAKKIYNNLGIPTVKC